MNTHTNLGLSFKHGPLPVCGRLLAGIHRGWLPFNVHAQMVGPPAGCSVRCNLCVKAPSLFRCTVCARQLCQRWVSLFACTHAGWMQACIPGWCLSITVHAWTGWSGCTMLSMVYSERKCSTSPYTYLQRVLSPCESAGLFHLPHTHGRMEWGVPTIHCACEERLYDALLGVFSAQMLYLSRYVLPRVLSLCEHWYFTHQRKFK